MIKTSDIINRRRHVASLWRIFENSTTVNSSNSNPNHLIHVSQKRIIKSASKGKSGIIYSYLLAEWGVMRREE